ncbi:MAG TPA: type II secretion system protein [Bacilli bacterium]|nr:type II secretion system protein [Bacilli bacterium]
MKNRGFTLVELLAVIALVAVFLLIAIPTVDTITGKQKQKLYKLQIENVKDALKTWGNVNIEELPDIDGVSVTVTLQQLKDEGLVEDNIKNPKTKKCYANSNTFTIARSENSFIYVVEELIDGDNTDCAS